MKIKYYIIHNLDPKRKNRMTKLLTDNGVDMHDVSWILHPNKNEITQEFKNKNVLKNRNIKNGYICCAYKHYLALEGIVQNRHEYAVIMEDNIGFIYDNIPNRLEKYLKTLPDDWDILFDSLWASYKDIHEEKVIKEKNVYKKSNEITQYCHGGTRVAQFYFLNLKCAQKLYDNYLPLGHAPDWWMNELFRKLNINSYWSEPAFINCEQNHKSSC